MHLEPNAALVLIDLQKGVHHPKLGRRNNPRAEDALSNLLKLWREASRPVVHVRHISRSPNSVFWPDQSGVEFQDQFRPLETEQVIEKNVPDAFCATKLEFWLRSHSITQLIVAGVATNNSVESTARTGGNLGFKVFVPEDACFTFDKTDFFGKEHPAEEVHAMSLANLHGEYATVLSSADLVDRK